MSVVIWSIPSYAKVNLHLEVVGRRNDGFHDLVTVFQTVSLADRVRLEYRPGSGLELEVAVRGPAAAGVPADAHNLAGKALLDLCRRAGISGRFHLELTKRIPAGGGLGGGSSNAAAVLSLFARELPGRVPVDLARAIAAQLGSDVPFFLLGGTALGRGRGEVLEVLPDLPRRSLWLVVPPFPAATPRVFGALRREEITADSPAIAARWSSRDPWASLIEHGRNALTGPALRAYPQLAAIESQLRASGADWVRLSGSGSTFVVGADRTWGATARALGVGKILRVRTVSRRQMDLPGVLRD